MCAEAKYRWVEKFDVPSKQNVQSMGLRQERDTLLVVGTVQQSGAKLTTRATSRVSEK